VSTVVKVNMVLLTDIVLHVHPIVMHASPWVVQMANVNKDILTLDKNAIMIVKLI